MANILISGASIAGPTAAHWLTQAGHRVTIVERAPGIRTGGYAIDVRGAALEIVNRMGLGERMREQGTDTLTNAFVDERWRNIVSFDRGFGVISPEDIEIMRGDLTQMLYKLTRDAVVYRFNDSITAIDEGWVSFATGQKTRFDFIVGADGLHSNVRALTFGDETPLIRQMGSAIAIFTANNHSNLNRSQEMMMAPGRVASIKSDRGNSEVKITLIFKSAPIDRHDPEAQMRAVETAFAGLTGPMPLYLKDMRDAVDFYFDMTSQARLPAWCKGRVALVGDAAYGPSPMTGQGTSLAIIGAYVLAQAINEGALCDYERTLRPFVERNQDVALQVSKGFAPNSKLAAWFRHLNMRMLPYIPWRNMILNMMMSDIKKAALAFQPRWS